MNPRNIKRPTVALALVELLIVLAMVAILTIIALPNYYRATTTAEVAQAKADLSAVRTAHEAYRVDHGSYIKMNRGNLFMLPASRIGSAGWDLTMERLTTPVSYLSSPAPYWDPFDAIGGQRLGGSVTTPPSEDNPDEFKQYYYVARDNLNNIDWSDAPSPTWYILESAGPDRLFTYLGTEMNTILASDTPNTRAFCFEQVYDPTNGLVSGGGIWKIGGTPSGRGSVFGTVMNLAETSRVDDWVEHEK